MICNYNTVVPKCRKVYGLGLGEIRKKKHIIYIRGDSMMPGVVRQGDSSAGHCFTPRPPDQWSSDVTVNGKGVVRKGDHWPTHCCGIPCHDGNSTGSHSVTANGKDVQVQGDPISCGDTAGACSSNVTIDG